jgi:hypothetical protein
MGQSHELEIMIFPFFLSFVNFKTIDLKNRILTYTMDFHEEGDTNFEGRKFQIVICLQ